MTEEDRYLLNYLATRIDERGSVRLDEFDEMKNTIRLLGKAQRRGLKVVSGQYIGRDGKVEMHPVASLEPNLTELGP